EIAVELEQAVRRRAGQAGVQVGQAARAVGRPVARPQLLPRQAVLGHEVIVAVKHAEALNVAGVGSRFDVLDQGYAARVVFPQLGAVARVNGREIDLAASRSQIRERL